MIIISGQLLLETEHRNKNICLEQEFLVCGHWWRRAQNKKFSFAVRNVFNKMFYGITTIVETISVTYFTECFF